MKEKTLRKDLWESAGYAGLALGLVSIVYMYINKAVGLSGMSTGMMMLAVMLPWIAKFIGCILLMKFFMKKFFAAHPESTNKDTFRMGMATALLSAFFYSAIQFVDMVYINAAQYETAMQQYSAEMDSNSRNMVKNFIEILPQFTFVWNLIYCFVYGTVLSAILSRNIPSQDPFADYKPE